MNPIRLVALTLVIAVLCAAVAIAALQNVTVTQGPAGCMQQGYLASSGTVNALMTWNGGGTPPPPQGTYSTSVASGNPKNMAAARTSATAANMPVSWTATGTPPIYTIPIAVQWAVAQTPIQSGSHFDVILTIMQGKKGVDRTTEVRTWSITACP